MSKVSNQLFWIVGGILAVLTVVEFIIAVNFENNLGVLTVFALAKAVLIIYYFMHIYRVWRMEEH